MHMNGYTRVLATRQAGVVMLAVSGVTGLTVSLSFSRPDIDNDVIATAARIGGHPMPDSEITREKLWLVEYERLKDEQKTRIGFRDNLVYATLASMAAVVAATLSAKGHANLLLLLPPVSTPLGWTFLINDEKVSAIGRYIREVLRPRLGGGAEDVLEWEIVHRTDARRRTRKLLQLAADLGLFSVPALAAIVVYWVNGPHTATFLTVSIVEVAIVAVLTVQLILYFDPRGATAPAPAGEPTA
jgi:hypothetical protein